MADHTFNFGPWLSRLGLKGGKLPDIMPVVQPVQVVGDASLLVPTLLPPTACYGRLVGGVASNYAALQIRSLAPGGTLLRRVAITIQANLLTAWTVRSVAATFAASTTLTAANMGPEPVVSEVKAGT
ncbi:unnamed protein product, partial [marine sediment metagenome]